MPDDICTPGNIGFISRKMWHMEEFALDKCRFKFYHKYYRHLIASVIFFFTETKK